MWSQPSCQNFSYVFYRKKRVCFQATFNVTRSCCKVLNLNCFYINNKVWLSLTLSEFSVFGFELFECICWHLKILKNFFLYYQKRCVISWRSQCVPYVMSCIEHRFPYLKAKTKHDFLSVLMFSVRVTCLKISYLNREPSVIFCPLKYHFSLVKSFEIISTVSWKGRWVIYFSVLMLRMFQVRQIIFLYFIARTKFHFSSYLECVFRFWRLWNEKWSLLSIPDLGFRNNHDYLGHSRKYAFRPMLQWYFIISRSWI